MLKHLLVPLDGSPLSEAALPIARHVLGTEGTLTLLNVVDLPDVNIAVLYDMPVISTRDAPDKLLAETRENALTYLQRLAEKIYLPSTVKVNIEVCVGNPTTTIVERAQALHVDAIVMSTHGRSGFSRWVFGSVTQRVLNLMPCPVLVVPGHVYLPDQPTPSDAVRTVS
jgi:nucleotide-binding universal stress UspA family protein